ncbi:MAG: hypothetical protein H7A36_08055, partial [Chlamydiales bacterium]|nr:hypothetical protein [Chlamydiales bacterium]
MAKDNRLAYVLKSACEERREKYPYERCKDDSDCQPGLSVVNETTHQVTNHYLRCDPEQKRCIERAPTELKDFNQLCGQEITDAYKLFMKYPLHGSFHKYLVTKTSSCSAGYCYLWANHAAYEESACMYQGCTKTCLHHEDCPQGSRCLEMKEIKLQEIQQGNLEFSQS